MTTTIITKANGEQEAFDATKLESSLLRAGTKPAVVEHILETIQKELTEGMTTREIYRHAFSLLGKKDKPVAANYSLRRAVMDMGPSGFPFEKLIAEIFSKKGYTTVTGKRIRGKCVEHEIDVLAYNEAELHLVEAKFHNQLGVKTDTKVALYVKARYDDIRDVEIDTPEGPRTMTKGWLITNTKFTHSAITYSKCQDLRFVGWNYPQKGNLHDMILETGLHPLTCLTKLSKAEEKILLESGITLLRHIKADPSVLNVVGMSEEKKKEIIAETEAVLQGSGL